MNSGNNGANGAASLALIVFSGGLDSTVLAAHYRDSHRLLLLSFDYGQRHAARELLAAREVAAHFSAEHHIADMSAIGSLMAGRTGTARARDTPETMASARAVRAIGVPNRNAIITDVAVGVAMSRRAELVALGVQRVRTADRFPVPDATPEFFDAYRAMVGLASRGSHTPRIDTPFMEMRKEEVIAYGHKLGAPLEKTWTCCLDGLTQCGECHPCDLRRRAFSQSGVTDPTVYGSETDAARGEQAELVASRGGEDLS
jgi:7-cyano-7-deazaguanine synthase